MSRAENLFVLEMRLRIAACALAKQTDAKTRAKLRRAALKYAREADRLDEMRLP